MIEDHFRSASRVDPANVRTVEREENPAYFREIIQLFEVVGSGAPAANPAVAEARIEIEEQNQVGARSKLLVCEHDRVRIETAGSLISSGREVIAIENHDCSASQRGL